MASIKQICLGNLVAFAVLFWRSHLRLFVLSAVAIFDLSYFCFWVFVYPFYFSPFRNLPEPKGAKFPWGHAAQIRHSSNGAAYRNWINSTPNDGIIRFRVFMNQERLLLVSPDGLRQLLVTKSYQFTKPPEPRYLFQALLGNGILVAEGEDHKRQRKGLMPAFAYRHIKDLYPVFWSKAKESVEAISAAQKYSNDAERKALAPQSAYNWAHRTTLDIIGLAGLGHDFKAIADPGNELVKAYHAMFSEEGPLFYWGSIGFDPPMRYVLNLPMARFSRILNAKAKIQAIAQKLVAKKKVDFQYKDTSDVSILSVAMESGVFSDEDLVNQMMTFLAAGHETTASALTWATYLLCVHPHIQTRLREEIREKLPPISNQDSEVTAAQLDGLPYLNAVCQEVLRFMPSVPMTMRDAIEDTEILGHPIAKGTRIIVPAWAVNVSIDLWGEDSRIFNPDRWLADRQANSGGAKSNFANLTFIHGPRSCIGKDFARSEFLCLLAAWVGKFEIGFENERLPEDIIGWVTVKPKHALPVIFKEAEGW